MQRQNAPLVDKRKDKKKQLKAYFVTQQIGQEASDCLPIRS